MRALQLTLKDLRQVLGDRRSLFFLVAMPLAFTLFMGFAAGGGGGKTEAPLALGWANADGAGAAAARLEAGLRASSSIRLVPLSEAEGRKRLGEGGIAALLIVPEGFGKAAAEGGEARLALVADPAAPSTQTLFQLVRAPLTRIMSAGRAASLAVESIASERPGVDRKVEGAASFAAASRRWADTVASSPALRQEAVVTGKARASAGNPYNQSSPGMLVMFAVFGLINSAGVLVQEKRSGTLRRLRATAMGSGGILSGHLGAMFALVFLQSSLLVAFGQAFLGVDYFQEWAAVFLVLLALGLCMASADLLIGVLAASEEQVTLYGLAAMFLFSALGGAWFPLEGAGPAFASIGRLTPGAWAMTGLQNVLVRGLGLGSAVIPSAALLGFAALFGGGAYLRFRKAEAGA
jgi:ABC-2 type transport system permease protein